MAREPYSLECCADDSFTPSTQTLPTQTLPTQTLCSELPLLQRPSSEQNAAATAQTLRHSRATATLILSNPLPLLWLLQTQSCYTSTPTGSQNSGLPSRWRLPPPPGPSTSLLRSPLPQHSALSQPAHCGLCREPALRYLCPQRPLLHLLPTPHAAVWGYSFSGSVGQGQGGTEHRDPATSLSPAHIKPRSVSREGVTAGKGTPGGPGSHRALLLGHPAQGAWDLLPHCFSSIAHKCLRP